MIDLKNYVTVFLTSLGLLYVTDTLTRANNEGGMNRNISTAPNRNFHNSSNTTHSSSTTKKNNTTPFAMNKKTKNNGATAALGVAAASRNADDNGGSSGDNDSSPSNSPALTTQPTDQNIPATPTPTESAPMNNDQLIAGGTNKASNNQTPDTDSQKDTQSHTDQTNSKDSGSGEDDKKQKEEEEKTAINEEEPIKDEAKILETLQILSNHNDKTQALLSNDSMNQLFNNFVHFKNFIVNNFPKTKILELCVELIDQIYPKEKVVTLKTNNAAKESSEKEILLDQSENNVVSDIKDQASPQQEEVTYNEEKQETIHEQAEPEHMQESESTENL